MHKAEEILNNTEIFNFNNFSKTHELVDTNLEVHNFLQDEMVHFEEIIGQDTYVFSDGSCITRLEDEYFFGDDVTMFKSNENLYDD